MSFRAAVESVGVTQSRVRATPTMFQRVRAHRVPTLLEASRERTTLKNPTMEAGVVREWLDGVQSGYGDRFTPALEEYGVENLQDLATLATTDKDELDKIFTDAGAKKMQLLNIHKGIELLTSSVPSPAPPEFPAPETAVQAAGGAQAPQPQLPQGWQQMWDQRNRRHYYTDHNTQQTHWELPQSVRRARSVAMKADLAKVAAAKKAEDKAAASRDWWYDPDRACMTNDPMTACQAKKAEDKAAASRDWWIQNPPMMGFSF